MYRDLLMKISILCQETEINTFVDSLDDVDNLFQSANPIVSEFFEHSFVETSYCKEIETLDWSSND